MMESSIVFRLPQRAFYTRETKNQEKKPTCLLLFAQF